MPADRDPWSSGGDATRREVREIFARHADHAAGRVAPVDERRSAVPGIVRLPGRLWRLLPTWGRVATGALLVALATAVAILLPPALENAADNRENQRRAEAANLEEIRQNLIASQRPRRTVLSRPLSAAGLAAAVGADFERRVHAGELEGPAGTDHLQASPAAAEPGGDRLHVRGPARGREGRLPRPQPRERLPLQGAGRARQRRRGMVQGEPAPAARRSGGVRRRAPVAPLHGLSYDRGVPLRTRLDEHHQGVAQFLWATCAGLVLLFIALAALDVVETGDAIVLTVAIVLLAVLWSAHEWLGLWRQERRNR